MKIQETMERIEEEYFQDTFGDDMTIEGDVYEEDEEI